MIWMCLTIKTTVSFHSVGTLYFLLHKFLKMIMLRSDLLRWLLLKESAWMFKAFWSRVSFLSYNPKHLEEAKTTAGHNYLFCVRNTKFSKQPRRIIIYSVPALELKCRVFGILGISLEIRSISNPMCEEPSISKFLIWNN